MRRLPCLAAVLSLLALAGCEGADPGDDNVAALDAELTGNDKAAAALGNRILVDPKRLAGTNERRANPTTPPRPATAANAADATERLLAAPPAKRAGACPECDAARRAVTLAGAPQRAGTAPVDCTRNLTYATDWAKRLPPDLPLHPQAKLTEAAGSQVSGCRFRVVSFTVEAPLGQLVDWYYTRATRAGYASGHQLDGNEHVLAGSRGRDGGVYVLFLAPDGPRTNIDMVLNKGV
ncbi:hypothetical protein [Sphingomonas desiccabilis]|uniref:DUF4893 domain-containing protein n=1 Tax=Sphingomonas desiccabilis TaxID=429134 RepID=A0A4Q2IZS0_9SPHN|nr:hypothetical protein [Sphingomonas desiccabilis]MBB3909810.1 hypothetical protein [Sphingomonas desiccabilis]RXZ34492.1 hypothetical protein EO081_02045 [Sphingomonas desiccabilis]